MKRHILIIIFISIILNNLHAKQWEILNEGIKRVYNFDFVDNKTGWLFGGSTLYKTHDAGRTWELIKLKADFSFYSFDFVNDRIGWASGSKKSTDNRIILKTEDGGFNWIIQKEFENTIGSRDFFALNDTTVYILSNNEELFKTTDGGANFVEVSLPSENKSYNEIYFISNDVGFVSGVDYKDLGLEAVLLKTNDGGLTWEEILYPLYSYMGDFQFLNGILYFRAYNKDNKSLLCGSSDLLATFSIRSQISGNINSFYVIDNQNIFTITEDYDKSSLIKSRDGGRSWQENKTGDFEYLNKIFFVNPSVGFLLGHSKVGGSNIWRSNDFGNNWVLDFFSYSFDGLFFINSKTGFAFGGYDIFHGSRGGDVFLTDDGGKTWSLRYNTSQNGLTSCVFTNLKTGFIITNNNWVSGTNIIKTRDGGTSWETVLADSLQPDSASYYSMQLYFKNISTGWVVGKYYNADSSGASILGTIDGGENWEVLWKNLNQEGTNFVLNSIRSIDNIVWTVGENGLIVKYDDQDKWQERNDITELPLNDVFFSDKNHGWISGGYHNWNWSDYNFTFLKTSDGGENWKETTGINYQINDMYFEDNLHGWAVGVDSSNKGIILETTDGAENWETQVDSLSSALNAISFTDGYGWVVGDLGLVLRTRDGSTWIDESKVINFELDQNYPNPFNPKTTIKYKLYGEINQDQTVFIDLSVYNIMGQKVETLISKKQTAGNYQVEWDATGFASGVYFYRIFSKSGYSQSRKLLLLK